MFSDVCDRRPSHAGRLRRLVGAGCAALCLTAAASAQVVLRVAADGPPRTLDPAQALDPLHYRYLAQIYEAPLECVVDDKGLLDVRPALCELTSLSADLKTLRLKVRPGARFHDADCFEDGKGRDATARDVAASLLRHADPAVGSPAWPLFMEGRFVGVDAWRDAAKAQRGVDYEAFPEGVRVEGDEVVLELVEPYPALRALLSQPWAFVMPFEAARGYGGPPAEKPVGTGPFRYADADRARVRLTRHPGYRIAGKPAVDELRFELTPDADAAATRFLAGDLDALEILPAGEKRFLDHRQELLAEHRVKGRTLVDGVPLSVSYLVFNAASPLFADAALRRAVMLAVDRAALAKALLGERALRADCALPPTFPEAGALAAQSWPDGARNLAKAAATLKAAGRDAAGVPPFVVDVPGGDGDPRAEKAGKLLVAQLKEAGFRATLQSKPFSDFADRAGRGEFSLAWTAWFADYPDAENFLLLFRSDRAGHGRWESNWGRFADDKVDALYLDVAARLPGKERLLAAGELLTRVRDLAAWVPIAYPRGLLILNKGVRGMTINLMNWSYRDAVKG
ncbi:MAG TPA: ABC transporter substrate-binding protein [Planctomycetota bacterium]|nr:ABC transporter substrate-binding protein [Planctomycetota bacterium]